MNKVNKYLYDGKSISSLEKVFPNISYDTGACSKNLEEEYLNQSISSKLVNLVMSRKNTQQYSLESVGITTLPNSSILLTMPVDFIFSPLSIISIVKIVLFIRKKRDCNSI